MEYYYIRNEGYLGNALLWWAKGGGYTCDISPEDSTYNYKYIDNLTESQKLIIDSQYVDDKKRLWKDI